MGLFFRTIDTVQGHVGFVASRRGLRRVFLPYRSAASLKRAIREIVPGVVEDPNLMPDLADALQRYFTGERVDFDVRLDGCDWTSFELDVWQACRHISYGQTRSYKHLAEHVGRPGGARAIGMAMSRNPCPIVVPCHRVVKSDGSLGGFSSPGGVDQKRQLLDMEAAAVHA